MSFFIRIKFLRIYKFVIKLFINAYHVHLVLLFLVQSAYVQTPLAQYLVKHPPFWPYCVIQLFFSKSKP